MNPRRRLALVLALVLALQPVAAPAVAVAQERQTVFVHGLASSPATWDVTATRLRNDLLIVTYQPDLPWNLPYQTQAVDLHNELWWLPGDTIAMGHSNGGVISREWSRMHPLSGVMTVGSPHQGAPVVNNIVNLYDFNWYIGWSVAGIYDTWYDCFFYYCDLMDVWYSIVDWIGLVQWASSATLGEVIYTLGISTALPVIPQMAAFSPYFADLNSGGNLAREVAEIPSRVGVVSIQPDFLDMGVFGAVWPSSAYTWDYWMDVAWSALYFGAWTIIAFTDPMDIAWRDRADAMFNLAGWIDSWDWIWCRTVSWPGGGYCDANDSVLPWWTQEYPYGYNLGLGYAGQFHTQETRSEPVRAKFDEALRFLMSVPPRSGGPPAPGSLVVSFQASNGQYMVAEGGGGGDVNANRSAIGPWEKFTIVDLNGGSLNAGDPVAFRTDSGHYLQAAGNGGGPMRAEGAAAGAWETFVIVDQNGGSLESGDPIALQFNGTWFVCAEGGGGQEVNVNRTAIGSWETFVIIFH